MLEDFKSYIADNDVALIIQILIGVGLIVIPSLLIGFRKFIWNMAKKIPKALLDRLVDRVSEEVIKSFNRHNLPTIIYTLKEELEMEMSRREPAPPPQGISGTPCPESGLYFSQQFPDEQKVFGKDEILTEIQDSRGWHIRTYWIRQDPASYQIRPERR